MSRIPDPDVKKLAEYCAREGIRAELPCYKVTHKYRGKTVTFSKPLFPGYVFLVLTSSERARVYQSEYVANLLDVIDQPHFERQLHDIFLALESDLILCLAPEIGEGTRVKIKSGPLRGIDGWVEKRSGASVVLLRLDFIGQAALLKVEATDLELV